MRLVRPRVVVCEGDCFIRPINTPRQLSILIPNIFLVMLIQ